MSTQALTSLHLLPLFSKLFSTLFSRFLGTRDRDEDDGHFLRWDTPSMMSVPIPYHEFIKGSYSNKVLPMPTGYGNVPENADVDFGDANSNDGYGLLLGSHKARSFQESRFSRFWYENRQNATIRFNEPVPHVRKISANAKVRPARTFCRFFCRLQIAYYRKLQNFL